MSEPNKCWSGVAPLSSDGLKFNRELWDYYMTADAVSGLRSTMGIQLDTLRNCGPVAKGGGSSNTGAEGVALAAISKYKKTWARLQLIPWKMQVILSHHYGGKDVSEHEVAAAHKAFMETK